MATPLLDRIAAEGNRVSPYPIETYGERAEAVLNNWITCADGYRFSVCAGWGMHCLPRPGWGDVPNDYAGPYTAVEVLVEGSEHPAPEWSQYGSTDDVYGQVPVDVVRALIEAHGGER